MIPNHRALVPVSLERQAAVRAILYVEDKLEKNPQAKMPDYPYARAFFRYLSGKSKITGKFLNRISGISWDAKDNRRSLSEWGSAFDIFISSRGRECPLPLPCALAKHIFPEIAFAHTQREQKRWERKSLVYSKQNEKARNDKEEKYQSLVGQAEIDLAFQTPTTLRAWYQRWSQRDIKLYDLERIFWPWTARFPSLSHIRRWYLRADEPLWQVVQEVWCASQSASDDQKSLENWLVPNKITLKVK